MTINELIEALEPFKDSSRKVRLWIDTDCGQVSANPTSLDTATHEDILYVQSMQREREAK